MAANGRGEAAALRSMLTGEVLPFWERSVDRGSGRLENGGYDVERDESGAVAGTAARHLVATARMIYTFSVGARVEKEERADRTRDAGPTGRAARWLEHARHGVEFLRETLGDGENGGFLLLADRDGAVRDASKWPYGIAFAVYGLAEYHRQSGDAEALRMAVETFDLLERHAFDHDRGGIYESLAPDWLPVSRIKRAGHTLHTIEAVSSLLAATGEQRYRDLLAGLCGLLRDRFFDPETACLHEHFTEDWRRDDRRTRGLVLYGHMLEASWFLQTVGLHLEDGNRRSGGLLAAGRRLLEHVLRYGWDQAHGGVFMSGRPEGGAVDTGKMWWVQAVCLGALSAALRVTGDAAYLDWLRRQWAFVRKHQSDRAAGEWHMLLHADGTVHHGLKGHGTLDALPIKTGYHVSQALYHAAANLEAVDRNEPQTDADGSDGADGTGFDGANRGADWSRLAF